VKDLSQFEHNLVVWALRHIFELIHLKPPGRHQIMKETEPERREEH